MTADDRLLELLAGALDPGPVQPPPTGIAAVRLRADDGRRRAATRGARGPGASRRRVLVGAAALASVIAAFVLGLAVAENLPRPVREVAHGIGLPVDSPALVDARHELHRLGQALAACDLPAVGRADPEMVRLVKSLDADERAKVEPVAHEVHLRAVSSLARNTCA